MEWVHMILIWDISHRTHLDISVYLLNMVTLLMVRVLCHNINNHTVIHLKHQNTKECTVANILVIHLKFLLVCILQINILTQMQIMKTLKD
jgi:hypothetical protein